MENKTKPSPSECSLNEICKFFINPFGPAGCRSDATSNCSGARHGLFLEAEPSDFHDDYLIAVTKKLQKTVKDILAEIPPDEGGRTLSFLFTGKGVLLAWVNHQGERLPGAVSSDDGYEALAAALKLVNR
jgi:hypothetical protein